MREFTRQEQTLYRWKVTEDLRIIKHEIHNWDITENGAGSIYAKKYYIFRIGDQSTTTYLSCNDIDVFKHNKYFSFTDDDEKVRAIVIHHLTTKVTKAQKELDRTMRILQAFKQNNP